jgi:hypothetical protein
VLHSRRSGPRGSGWCDLKRFLNNISELPVVTDDSLAIRPNAEQSRSILAANAVSNCIRDFKNVYSGGNGGSLGDDATLGIETASGLT